MITDYVAVDLEMTGVDPRRDQILEIGAVKCRAGRPPETFARLIRPSVPIPEPVVRLTGITEEMAAGGADADRAMEEFFRFAEELPLVGHQLMCDYSFLKQWAVDHSENFYIPEEGTNIYVDAMCIPKGAANKENAEAFINYMCSTAAGLKNCEEIWYSTPLLSVREELDEATASDPYAYPDEAVLAQCESFKNLPQEILDFYDSEWTRLMLAAS